MNQQPMGFWSLETIKEDAKRHDIEIMFARPANVISIINKLKK